MESVEIYRKVDVQISILYVYIIIVFSLVIFIVLLTSGKWNSTKSNIFFIVLALVGVCVLQIPLLSQCFMHSSSEYKYKKFLNHLTLI